MPKLPVRFARRGFTLIELLIVIVIIGILAGVVLVVLNPAKQQRKSAESVLAANTNKLCLALNACAAVAPSATGAATCAVTANLASTLALLGAADPTGVPTGSTYTPTVAGDLVTLTGTLAGVGGSKTANVGCSYSCAYNFDTGVPTKFGPVVSASSVCY